MKATVIIPYYERKEYIQKILDALLKQTVNSDDYEIIVVDDGSKDSIENIIPLNVCLISTKHKGAAAARNRGVLHAKGDIVIFLDSDIIVTNTFVENHCRFHEKNANSVALGPRLHMDSDEKVIQSIDTRLKLLMRYNKTISELNHPWFMTYTCNVSVSKELATQEPFDEHFISWGLEDSEWAYRLYKRKSSFSFIEALKSFHLYHDRSMSNERFIGWKKNLDYLLIKHPELKILKYFIGVFDPQKRADYFEMYDKFESEICVY